MAVPVRGRTLKRALRISTRIVSALLALGVGVIAILAGAELIGESHELMNEARLRQEKSVSGLFATSLEHSVNLQIVAKIPVVFGVILVVFGVVSWWRPSVRLGLAMALTSLCMLLTMYISLEVWPVGEGFIFGHRDFLWAITILAAAAGGAAGGLLTAGFSRWTSVDDGTP